jgi:hypothetical protein
MYCGIIGTQQQHVDPYTTARKLEMPHVTRHTPNITPHTSHVTTTLTSRFRLRAQIHVGHEITVYQHKCKPQTPNPQEAADHSPAKLVRPKIPNIFKSPASSILNIIILIPNIINFIIMFFFH